MVAIRSPASAPTISSRDAATRSARPRQPDVLPRAAVERRAVVVAEAVRHREPRRAEQQLELLRKDHRPGEVGGPPLDDGTLSVRDGRAVIQLRMKGSVIGRLTKGRITVTESPADTTTVVVRGWESRKADPDGRTVTYIGVGIRFRIADDKRFVVKLSGKGLNFSAVGRGDGWIDGWGDPDEDVFYDGTYTLNGDDFPTLPNERTRFELAAPPSP